MSRYALYDLICKVVTTLRRLRKERTLERLQEPQILDTRYIRPDAVRYEIPNRYVPGEPVEISGSKLDFNATRQDEGVFLIDTLGLEERIDQTPVISAKRVLFVMPIDSEGEYILELRRRPKQDISTLNNVRFSKSLSPL